MGSATTAVDDKEKIVETKKMKAMLIEYGRDFNMIFNIPFDIERLCTREV